MANDSQRSKGWSWVETGEKRKIVSKDAARVSRQRGSKLRRSSVCRNLFSPAQPRDGEETKDHSRRIIPANPSPTLAVAKDADVGEKIHCGVKTRRRCNPRLSSHSPPLPLLFLFRFCFFLFCFHVRLCFLFNIIPSNPSFTLSTSDTCPQSIFRFIAHKTLFC